MQKLFALMFLFLSLSVAKPIEPINKAVFDCSAEDMHYIYSRMKLIERTAQDFNSSKEPYQFVLTVHSHCTPIVSKESLEYVEDKEVKLLKNIQKQLIKLMEIYKVDIRVCKIALKAHFIEPKTLLPNIKITKNSFLDVIRLQNRGYALFPLIQ